MWVSDVTVQPPQKTRHIEIMLVYCWASVADDEPTLYQHYFKVWCLLGIVNVVERYAGEYPCSLDLKQSSNITGAVTELMPDRPSTLCLLITTTVVLNLFYQSIKSLILGIKCVFKQHDLQMF